LLLLGERRAIKRAQPGEPLLRQRNRLVRLGQAERPEHPLESILLWAGEVSLVGGE
jgi:hypothetical protein